MTIIKPILLELPMPIRTPRLTIVPAHPDHAQAMHEAVIESVNSLRPWMDWAKNIENVTVEERKEMLVNRYAQFIRREEFVFYAFTHKGEFIVSLSLHDVDWGIPLAKSGYWCRESAQGKGYTTEAMNAFFRYAFDIMKMRKISFRIDSENRASQRVAEKLNMIKEYEELGGTRTLHEGDALRLAYNYSCFDPATLPPLEVSWG